MRINLLRIIGRMARFSIGSVALAIIYCCPVPAAIISEGALLADTTPPITKLNFYEPRYVGTDGSIFITTFTPLLVTGADVEISSATTSYIKFIGYTVNREVASVDELGEKLQSSKLPLGRHTIRYGSSDHAGNVEKIRVSSVSVVPVEKFIRDFNPLPEMENAGAIKGYLVRNPKKSVQLNEIQRRQFIAMLNWNSLIGEMHNRSSCNNAEALQFVGAGASIMVIPDCEFVLLAARIGAGGEVRARGLIPGSRRGWEVLRDSLFPHGLNK